MAQVQDADLQELVFAVCQEPGPLGIEFRGNEFVQ